MTSIPASRSARAMIFAPRSCPSSPTLAITTRIVRTPATAAILGGPARPPEQLLPTRVGRARQDEQEVGEPVQVHGRERIDLPLARHLEHLALRAPAEG